MGYIVMIFIPLLIIFGLVHTGIERFGVTDPFWEITIDAIIATLFAIYFIKNSKEEK